MDEGRQAIKELVPFIVAAANVAAEKCNCAPENILFATIHFMSKNATKKTKYGCFYRIPYRHDGGDYYKCIFNGSPSNYDCIDSYSDYFDGYCPVKS